MKCKNRYLCTGILALMMVLCCSGIMAQQISNCPASPYPVNVKQADGSTLTIVGKGGLRRSWTETTDGYTVVSKNGNYEYAEKVGGKLVPTGVIARNVQQRKPQETEFLRKQTKSLKPDASPSSGGPALSPGISGISGSSGPQQVGYPATGNVKALLILIKYPNLGNTYTNTNFNNLMNQANYRGTGSFKDFYTTSSFGQLNITTDVFGWYTAINPYTYYGYSNGFVRSTHLVREAVDAAEAAGVDFSRYDNDGDGVVDGIIVAHSGPGAEEGSQGQYIWSHRWVLAAGGKQVTYDGKLINDYIINPERRLYTNDMVGRGIFCHEFGHNLGLPDLYDTDGSSEGLGEWSLMASASWLGNEHTPGNMCAWSREWLGWLTPTVLTDGGSYSLNAASGSSEVYRINTPVASEYFLLENRQKTGLDVSLNGSGLAIFHINTDKTTAAHFTNNDVNADEDLKGVDLEEADGWNDLDYRWNRGDAGDLFPGSSGITDFNDGTYPSAQNYNGGNSGICIANISIDGNGKALFDFNNNPGAVFYRDADGDGYGDPNNFIQSCSQPVGYVTDNTDCNDYDYNIHPGAQEICNNLDDDCDGLIDEDGAATVTYYRDMDGDGYGDPNNFIQSCSPPWGYVTGNTDCNDNNVSIHPFAPEICNGLDDDCDGLIDEDAGATTYYRDMDGDGYGNPSDTVHACTQPPGYVTDSTDCNDNNFSIHPFATEVCNGWDDDCDGQIDEGLMITYYRDMDGDGYGNRSDTLHACTWTAGYVTDSTDCNDNNTGIHPGAIEMCNGLDDDCDGLVDEDVFKNTYYRDADGDGYGNDSISLQACSMPPGYVWDSTDCNDNNFNVHPWAMEMCNGIDDNCNGQIDEGFTTAYYKDADGDNYGDRTNRINTCSQPFGYVMDSTDCNDNNSNIHPWAMEVCNGLDDDCDGQVDENATPVTWYRDKDGDGYGNLSESVQSCTQPAGYVSDSTDCDDNDATVYPTAPEICDGKDNNCNGVIDENIRLTFYRDADNDGYGDPEDFTEACSAPAGYTTDHTDCDDNNPAVHSLKTYYVDADGDGYGSSATAELCTAATPAGYATVSGDCNDGNAAVHPNATEVSNGIDDDCDGVIDEGTLTTFYKDYDRDTYGNDNNKVQASTAPAGYVARGGDCNDTRNTIYPGAPEICDNLDNDCDGVKDDGLTLTTFYKDYDKDTYGSNTVTVQACTAPVGYVAVSGDCNDAKNTVYPGATEIADNLDNDCDGQVDEGLSQTTFYKDYDKDGFGNNNSTVQASTAPAGYVATGGDCNDLKKTVYPGAPELCDNLDNDCDGQVDEDLTLTTFYKDYDKDGFGNSNSTKMACIAPAGYVSKGGDCNDTKNTVYPGAPELCDNLDNDCDGQVDEGLTLKTFYKDYDKDGYGNNNSTKLACIAPAGYVSIGGDCNDTKSAINPGAKEVFNGIDDNCNGQVDETYDLTVSVPDKVINEVTGQMTVKVAPNPSAGHFTVSIQSGSDQPVQIRVLDVSGKLVEAKSHATANGVLQLGGMYRPGMYVLEVVQGKERKTVKLIKQAD